MAIKLGIVVGELSGDNLGADLVRALQRHYPDLIVSGIAGPAMQALGAHSLFPIEKLSFMGYIEPLRHLPEIVSIRKKLAEHFIQNKPDIFIGIDAPDFNLGLEETLRKKGIKVVHYVSPSVWAWRRWRIKKIARAVDLILALLPFEVDFYKEHNIPVNYVGHPLADSIPDISNKQEAREALGLPKGKKIIALLPGSRKGEVKSLSRLFLACAKWCFHRDENIHFCTAIAKPHLKNLFLHAIESINFKLPITIIEGNAQKVIAASDCVLAASGTVSLECALIKRPTIVSYRVSFLTEFIVRRMLKINYVSIANLLADEALLPEYLGRDATVENIAPKLLELLSNKERQDYLDKKFSIIHQQLKCNASEQAAKAIIALLPS